MATYGQVSGGTCVNVFAAEEDFRDAFAESFPDDEMVGPLDDLDPQPGIGWGYDGQTWTPPPGPEQPEDQSAP